MNHHLEPNLPTSGFKVQVDQQSSPSFSFASFQRKRRDRALLFIASEIVVQISGPHSLDPAELISQSDPSYLHHHPTPLTRIFKPHMLAA